MKRLGVYDASPKTLSPSRGILARAGLAAVVGSIRNIGIGAQNLLAWSDSGKVVPPEVADSRALICTAGGPGNTRCPMNGTGDWKQTIHRTSSGVDQEPTERKGVDEAGYSIRCLSRRVRSLRLPVAAESLVTA